MTMPPLSLSILQNIARRHRWSNCAQSPSGTGGADHPLLLFSDHRHPGTLRLAFDGDSALLLSLDLAAPEDLATAFPGWPLDGNTLHLPVDPPNGNALLDLLPPVLKTLDDLASGKAVVVPVPPPVPVAAFATARKQLILARNGQGLYREQLLALWGNACAVTGLANPDFLRASHAKPWKDATDAERLDPANGLPLVPNLDLLFDGGWITFSDTGVIRLSSSLDPAQAALLGVTPSLRLRQPPSPAQQAYLSYHRTHVFRSPPPPPPPPLSRQRPPRPARPLQPPPPPPAAPASASRPPRSFLADFRSGDPLRPFAHAAANTLPDDALPEAWTDLPDGHGGAATTAILASIPGKWALVRPEDYPDAAPLARRGWQLFSSDGSPEAFADFLRNLQPRTRP